MSSRNATSDDETPYMNRCLSFTVQGPWGHFKRPEGSVAKRTFRIIPRTTIAGLLAAIVGAPRDTYYDVFQTGNAGVAVTPETSPTTMSLPETFLSTESFNRAKPIKAPDPTKERQRYSMEVLRNPAYRIDVTLADTEFYTELKQHLENGTSVYTPSLGLSELLADITYHGEHTITAAETDDIVTVDSVVPDAGDRIVPDPGREYATEHSPAVMERVNGHERITTAKASITYTHDAGSIQVRDLEASRIETETGSRTVKFF